MKKLISAIIFGFLLFDIIAMTSIGDMTKLQNFDYSDIIDEFTWSIIRGDFSVDSEFGTIQVPKPSEGTVLIPGNMLSKTVCRTAVLIYSEDKMATLKALEEYDVDNMIHCDPAFFNGINEWNSPTIENYRKNSADEMALLGEICFRGDLVGDCYSQACFNTAVLRLCGFSPEEVFTIIITGHALNIVNIDEKWYVFDSAFARSVKLGYRDSLIFDFYEMSSPKRIFGLENDKYFINFGNANDHFYDPYSNMDPDLLIDIARCIVPMFNNSNFSHWEWGLDDIDMFVENATAFPDMLTIGVPFTVEDSVGVTVEEKTQSLQELVTSFILNQTGRDILNQYDRSLYVSGLLSVDYPQAYANAAKYAAWTSYFGGRLDTSSSNLDCFVTGFWIRLNVFNRQILPRGYVVFSDLPYLRHAGSSIDKAVMAYGTLRNMDKDDDFWQPEDLYVIITNDYEGFLAVKIRDDWEYLNFGDGQLMVDGPPENLFMSFNEVDCLNPWYD